MAEITYAGYVPTSRPDYSALSNDLAEKIYGVLDKRQERREKLDEIDQANQKLLNSWMPGKNQTSNDFLLKGIDRLRKDALQWNKDLKAGKITESEYVRRNRNLEENYQMLINVFKSKDERVDVVTQRQEPDENGYVVAPDYEMNFFMRDFGDDMSMKNKELMPDGMGGMYIAEVDPATGLITNQIKDVRSIANPDNLTGIKVDLPSVVDEATKNWSPDFIWKDLGLKGEENIETIKQKTGYEQLLARTVNSIASDNNPRAQLSIITDNGLINPENGFEIGDEPEYVKSTEEYNQALQQKIDEELQTLKDAGKTGEELKVSPERMKKLQDLIFMWSLNEDGAWMPQLTDEQRRLAKDAVKNQIDFSFSEKVTGTPLQVPVGRTPSGPSGPGRQPSEEKPITKYRQIADAWETGNFNLLSANLNDKNYIVGPNRDKKGKKIPGYALYSKNDLSYQNPIPKTGSNGIDDFWLIKFFGSSPTQEAEGARQQKIWRQEKYGGNAAPSKPTNVGKAPRG